MRKSTTGFTIVELLIVIVVIAILAAISIVAYTGIQNRANNSAVQNDLAAAVKALELYKIDNSEYPDTLVEVGAMSSIAPLKASKSAYTTGTAYNYAYCSTPSTYGLATKSKSGTAYYITNSTGSVQIASSWGTVLATHCSNMGISSPTYMNWGYRGDTQAWQSWVSG